MSWTVEQVAQLVGGRVVGDGHITVQGMDAMDEAGPGDLTFIGSDKYARRWPDCKASAALINAGLQADPGPGRALIVVDNVDLTVAKILASIAPPPVQPELGIHPSAVLDPTAHIHETARVGPQCYIGRRVHVGPGAVIHASVTLHDDVRIGANTVIWSGTVIRERCTVGQRCLIHPNASIGADGFGFRPSADGKGLVKIPQIGSVEIGDDVEIGSSTCIDRGKFAATVIGDGCKIDNLVQIAHNVVLGKNVIIAGGSGIGGSTKIGDCVIIGAQAGIRDHITVGPNAQIAAKAAVMGDVEPGAIVAGYPAKDVKIARREYASIGYLPEMVKAYKKSRGDKAD